MRNKKSANNNCLSIAKTSNYATLVSNAKFSVYFSASHSICPGTAYDPPLFRLSTCATNYVHFNCNCISYFFIANVMFHGANNRFV